MIIEKKGQSLKNMCVFDKLAVNSISDILQKIVRNAGYYMSIIKLINEQYFNMLFMQL